MVVMLRSKNISHRTKYKKWVITGEPPNYTNLDRTCDIFLYQPRCSSSRFSLGIRSCKALRMLGGGICRDVIS